MATNLESYRSSNDAFREEQESLRDEVTQSPRKKQTPSRRVPTNPDKGGYERDEIKELSKDRAAVDWHNFNTTDNPELKSHYWKKIVSSKIDLKILDNTKYGKNLEEIKNYLLDYKKWTKIVFDKGVKYHEIKSIRNEEFDKLIDKFISKYGKEDIAIQILRLDNIDLELENISKNGNKLTKVYHELDD